VVEAVNQLPEFHIKYPRSLSKQKKIAKGFKEKSEVGFSNCAGCVDGLLIWTHKPLEKYAKKAGVGRKKFLCGQKRKFGLNCQAISDVHKRILDISIVYGGVSLDCLAFEGSDIFEQLEAGLLHDKLVFFVTMPIWTPNKWWCRIQTYQVEVRMISFFSHPQLCIRVEFAFGMLVFVGAFWELPHHVIFL
jgi:hypothetical protein